MSDMASPYEIERFRAAILHRFGLHFDDSKLGFLSAVLQRRTTKLGCSAEKYLYVLEEGGSAPDLSPLAEELTVTETYFFRNIEQFHVLEEVVLPERMRSQPGPRTINILSAACASGEEPYTIAICARRVVSDPSYRVSIRAVDINPVVLEKARRGRYSSWAFRETSPEVQQAWFHSSGRDMAINDSARGLVTFEQKNLANDDPDLWRPEFYDAVYCRNAMMYFAPEHARTLISRIARSLVPGGYLFLGHAETLRGLSDDFHLRHTHGTFYYERKGRLQRPPYKPDYAVSPPSAAVVPAIALNDSWVHAIHNASERVEALVSRRGHADTIPATKSTTRNLTEALELVHNERYADALAYVRAQSDGEEHDADFLLLEAMVLVQRGDIPAAEEVCRKLLSLDELNAGAHYVLALCKESAGDRDGAIENDRVAIYLDSSFAMPHLHVGLIARRAGDRALAQSELRKASAMLKHEDAARLLLFGGGFSRQSLIALCDSALRELGVPS